MMSEPTKPPVALTNQVGSDQDSFGSDQVVHPGRSKLIKDDAPPTGWDPTPPRALLKRTSIIGTCLVLVGILMITVGGLTFYSLGYSSRHLFEGFLVGCTNILAGVAAIALKFIYKNLKSRQTVVRYTAFLILLGIANCIVGFCDSFFVIFKLISAHNMFKSGVESEFQSYDPRSHTMFLTFAILHMVLIVLMIILGVFLMFSTARIRHETIEEKEKSASDSDCF